MPILNSYSAGEVDVYLDFNGDTYKGQYRDAYDIDGDPDTFNGEGTGKTSLCLHKLLAAFAAFDINVTTVKPTSVFVNGEDTWIVYTPTAIHSGHWISFKRRLA